MARIRTKPVPHLTADSAAVAVRDLVGGDEVQYVDGFEEVADDDRSRMISWRAGIVWLRGKEVATFRVGLPTKVVGRYTEEIPNKVQRLVIGGPQDLVVGGA